MNAHCRCLYLVVLALFMWSPNALKTVAASTAGLVVTVVNEANAPVSGATVTLSDGKTIETTTDAQGRATFNGIPADTYKITATLNGEAQVVSGVVVTADQSATYTLRLVAPTPPPTPAPTPPPVRATPPPEPVKDALVALYNSKNPLHRPGQYYFGRYTYVLLKGSTPANRSLIQLLAQLFGENQRVKLGPARNVDNPLGYNLFAIPVDESETDTGGSTTDQILAHYNWNEAKNIRNRYCNAPQHSSRSLCTAPLDAGPIFITFMRPLQGLAANAPLPPALAYDLSGVPESQFEVCIEHLSKAVVSSENIRADQMLTPPLAAKFLAPVLAAITQGLQDIIPQVKVFRDIGFGKPEAGRGSPSGRASFRW